ncbi:MAG: Fe-S protein assembly co-chaperone HscB [Terriglobales bacterium]|jgi:molecular chaperone HscB
MANAESKSSLIMPGPPADSSAEATPTCWSCGTMRAVHFCSSCGKVQPPKPVDYFTFFGFPRKLNLDTAALEKEFYALSRRLHPDVFGQAEDRERAWSLEQSSMLNDAYRTLKDPIKRTEYLLRIEGVELEEQSKQATEKARASGELKQQVVPADLLEEVFELNMHLEELRVQKKLGEDDPALLEEIGKAKLSLEEKYDALFDELETQWNHWDQAADSGTEADRRQILNNMLDVLNRRNYVRNLVRDVNEAME